MADALTLLAASNWPLGVLLALPVMVALFLPAYKLAQNSRQRIANMSFGLLGSFAGLIATGRLTYDPSHPMQDRPLTPVILAMVLGAVTGVALSVAIRKGATHLGSRSTTDVQAKPRLKPRWMQYSLRTLLVLTLLVAAGMSWFAVRVQRARRQREAVQAIQKLGGGAWYDYQFVRWGVPLKASSPPGPAWLRELVGEDLFADVVAVTLTGSQVTDDRLKPLAELPNLEWLSLAYTGITDGGLETVGTCKRLQGLILSRTRVTDKGMGHLRGLSHLQDVAVNGTPVTDEGIRRIQQALPRCSVNGYCVE